jgi:hypothetical protein
MGHDIGPTGHSPDLESQNGDARSGASLGAHLDVKTKIRREPTGSYEVCISVIHVRDGVTDVCDLPPIGGFCTPAQAAAYVLDWMDAWSRLNRPSQHVPVR